MALTFIKEASGMALYKADRRYWLTADRSRVVEDGHADAAYLLIGVGQEMPLETAKRHGIVKAESKPEDKAMPAPANKGRKA